MQSQIDFDQLPTITLGKLKWWGTNHQELLGIKQEIFQEELYDFEAESESPFIIDAGAHVGLATLFFRMRYPQSKIISVEPNPITVEILKYNLWFNRIENVEVIEAALSDQAGKRTLYMDASEDFWLSTSGYIEGAWNHEQKSEAVMVNTIMLDSLITQPVDFLKMDIEGAEEQVLRATRKIEDIKQMIVELHPEGKNYPKLDVILNKHNFTHSHQHTHYGLHKLVAKHL